MRKKQKAKARNWAAKLEGMTRLPAIKAHVVAAATGVKRSPAKCSWCLLRGHNVRTCTNPRAMTVPKNIKAR